MSYLQLNRTTASLSGGEAQRVRLAAQVGSRLRGVLYVLDEPTIGLHQRDNGRLIALLRGLRDEGNSVIVVEHDEQTIRAADYLLDLGPGAGEDGGFKVAEGPLDTVLASPDSLTAQPLAEELAALNRERQNLTLAKVELAQQQIAADRDDRGDRGDRYLYLVARPDFESGIVGLVAGRLVEDLYRPVLVAKVGEEETHGSARSISEFNITVALDECRELLVRHGGHAAAAGFAVKNENLETLRARLEAIAERQLAGATLLPSLPVDKVVAMESRGFILGGALADRLGAG